MDGRRSRRPREILRLVLLPVQRPGDAGRGSAVREAFRRGGREAGPGEGSPAGYPAGAGRRVRRHRGHRAREGVLPRDHRPRHAHHAHDAPDVQRQDARGPRRNLPPGHRRPGSARGERTSSPIRWKSISAICRPRSSAIGRIPCGRPSAATGRRWRSTCGTIRSR